jgi:hypothetical protein
MYVERKEPIHVMKISSERPPTIATGFIMFFAIVSFLVPFVVIGILLSSGYQFKFGFLITSAIFLATGYYLFRLASWNYNGVEVIEIFEDEVVYQPQTKWLTLSAHKFRLEGCILLRSRSEEEGRENYALRNGEQVVEMRFSADTKSLNQFENTLNQNN